MTDDVMAFGQALTEGGRLLGLDIGTKTVGMALCDSRWTFATAAETIDGSQSQQTQAARSFAQNLRPLGLPILLWDERWSTQAVTRDLIASDVSRKKRANVVDKMAAAYILQGAIDRLAALG